MVYKYRITLAGLKGFFRVYLIEGGNSLYTFHKQIRSDLEFPMDQPILFKAMDAEGQVVARYALMDIGYGAVDSVTVADTVKAGVQSFVYFYDIQNKKSVIITLEGEVPGEHVTAPKLVETKGPVPAEFENGYVAFEDMPEEKRRLPGQPPIFSGKDDDEDDEDLDEDDENDDDEDEDEDKEEEEIIYDENEQ